MNIKKLFACICAALTVFCLAFCLAGCSKDITVTIDDEGTTTEVSVEAGKTVSDVLAQAGIKVSDADEVTPALDSKVEASTKTITIKRYVNVTFVIYGTTNAVKMPVGTVQSALDSLSIVLAEGDEIDVDVNTPLTEGMVITITRAPEPEPEPEPETQYQQSEEKSSSNNSSGSGRTVERKVKVPNCADGSHGYYEIYYSDGSVEYQEY